MFKLNSGYGLELEVISGSNLVVPSHRMPTGFYVSVSNGYGRWNTAVKTLMVDHSVHWNQSLVIQDRPSTFPQWLMSIFSSSSKAVRLEFRALSKTVPLGQDEFIGAGEVQTTLQELLAHDGTQFELPPPVDGTRRPSLLLSARRVKLPRQPQSPLNVKPQTPRTSNVVIFGECGSGKSSVINAILQNEHAETSDGAVGRTSHHARHEVDLSGERFVLFDTVGLGEGTEGTMPAAKAEENLTSLLHELIGPGSDGIDLMVYCMRGSRSSRASSHYYNLFYSTICRSKVPIVVVATGLEDYGLTENKAMENWWEKNQNHFQRYGMHFKDHACVTTLPEDANTPDAHIQRIRESCKALRSLIRNNCSEGAADR